MTPEDNKKDSLELENSNSAKTDKKEQLAQQLETQKAANDDRENLKAGIEGVSAQTESTHQQVQATLNQKEVNIEDKNQLAEKGILALINELEEKIAGNSKPATKESGEKIYKIDSLPKAEMLTWLTDYVSKIEKYNELHRQNHPESRLAKTTNALPSVSFEFSVEKTETEIRAIQTEKLKTEQDKTPFYLFWRKPKTIEDLPDHLQEVPRSENFTLNVFNSNGQFYLETASAYGKQLLTEANYHDSTSSIENKAENENQEIIAENPKIVSTENKVDEKNQTDSSPENVEQKAA